MHLLNKIPLHILYAVLQVLNWHDVVNYLAMNDETIIHPSLVTTCLEVSIATEYGKTFELTKFTLYTREIA